MTYLVMTLQSRTLKWIVIIGVCLYAYHDSIVNDFVFDDHLAIVNNKDTFTDSPFVDIINNDIWGKNLQAVDSHRSFRPLLILLFKILRINFGLNPQIFRKFSIASHTLVTILVHELASITLVNPHSAFGVALLFGAHPVHVESVAAVVNIAESLSCLFYIVAYLLFDSTFPDGNAKSIIGLFVGLLRMGLWLMIMFAGILFKESALTVCGIVIGRVVIETIQRSAACYREQDSSKSLLFRLLALVNFRTCGWLIMSYTALRLYTIFRYVVISRLVPRIDELLSLSLSSAYLSDSQLVRNAENPFAFLEGREKTMSLMYLHFRYFYVMLWPEILSAEYSFDCIPKIADHRDPRFVLACGLYCGIFLSLAHFTIQIVISPAAAPTLTTRPFDSVAATGLQTTVTSEDNTMECDPHVAANSSVFDSGSADGNHTITASVSNGNNNACVASSNTDINVFPPAAILTCFMWMIVPFVPASGVFLRLGTLLAERLMYIPSIGYCMLLAVFLYSVSHRLPLPRTLSKALYWIMIVAITLLYCFRTKSYSQHWKTDATLFIESLRVCPRSAKLNLQVAKLYVNKQEYSTARVYVQRAKEIDPSFCDVQYQEALVALFADQNVSRALDLAVDNLQCVYTSTGALELLQKVFDLQVQEHPTNIAVWRYQADLASRGQLHSMAAVKYERASSLAYNAKNATLAIELARKAVQAFKKLKKDLVIKCGNDFELTNLNLQKEWVQYFCNLEDMIAKMDKSKKGSSNRKSKSRKMSSKSVKTNSCDASSTCKVKSILK